mmetsp:Transcript_4304/g.4934  ORF Transcript_4304/g.4934 Transcript_4304/m.4934 type:complete len:83 (+) Transcript_4304:79-327(+)
MITPHLSCSTRAIASKRLHARFQQVAIIAMTEYTVTVGRGAITHFIGDLLALGIGIFATVVSLGRPHNRSKYDNQQARGQGA